MQANTVHTRSSRPSLPMGRQAQQLPHLPQQQPPQQQQHCCFLLHPPSRSSSSTTTTAAPRSLSRRAEDGAPSNGVVGVVSAPLKCECLCADRRCTGWWRWWWCCCCSTRRMASRGHSALALHAAMVRPLAPHLTRPLQHHAQLRSWRREPRCASGCPARAGWRRTLLPCSRQGHAQLLWACVPHRSTCGAPVCAQIASAQQVTGLVRQCRHACRHLLCKPPFARTCTRPVPARPPVCMPRCLAAGLGANSSTAAKPV